MASSASVSAASSAIERPIVPPARPRSPCRARGRRSSARGAPKRGLDELNGFVESEAEVRANVEDDGLGADCLCRLHRGAERHERVLAHRRVAAREVDEIESVARDGFTRACRRRARKRATSSGVCSVGRHIRGLCVKTWTASPPISSTGRLLEMPPAADTWAPKSMRRRYCRRDRPRPHGLRPTGLLHIGGVRTFLFNWLFARGRGAGVPPADREHGHEP